jgi:hypothetical protein
LLLIAAHYCLKVRDSETVTNPDSPLDGAGRAADLIVSVLGVGRAIDAVDISVVDSTVRENAGGQAVVDVTVEADVIVEQIQTDVPLEMRTDSGDWYVWSVAV